VNRPPRQATPEGRRHTKREFTRALKAGALRRSAGLGVAKTGPKILEQQLMEQAREKARSAISMRVPIADLERAKQIAEESGVGYHIQGAPPPYVADPVAR
jgi:hypothetical protein